MYGRESNRYFSSCKKNTSVDIEVPLDIGANELVLALNQALELGMDVKILMTFPTLTIWN